MARHRLRHVLLTVVLLALPALTCGFGPAFQELVQRVTALEAESDETGLAIDGLIGDVAALEVESTDTAATIEELTTQVAALEADLASLAGVVEHELGLGPTTTLFDDDFEDGIDSEWVQTVGSTQTIEPTTCTGAHFYPSCGSLGLHFDESEQYDLTLSEISGGSFSLYFNDNPSDLDADATVGAVSPGAAEYIGVQADSCPNHYAVQLSGNIGKTCTRFQRREGWHRMEFVRNGRSSRGYIEHVLVFETNLPNTSKFELFRVIQNAPSPSKTLEGFAIDDVRFEAFE